MKIKGIVLKLTIAISIGLASLIAGVSAFSSPDFILDYSTINTGATHLSSNDFVVKAGLTSVETNSTSLDFGLTTINNFNNPVAGFCGDAIIQASLSEICEPTNLAGKTCADFGFNNGTLSCSICTSYDTSQCYNSGGGGVIWPIPPILKDPVEPEDPTEPTEPEETIKPEETIEPEEPYIPDIKPTPEPIKPPIYHPAQTADQKEKYKYHLDDYYIGEEIFQNDPSPTISDKLDKKTNYLIFVIDKKGKIIHEEKITSDNDGELFYEFTGKIDTDKYNIQIQDLQKNTVQNFDITILDDIDYKASSNLVVIEFAAVVNPENKYDKINILQVLDKKDNLIKGFADPNSKVFVYFESDQLYIEVGQADESGYFEITIPDELSDGIYTATIVQTHPDRVVGKSLKYKFMIETNIKIKNSDLVKSEIIHSIPKSRSISRGICTSPTIVNMRTRDGDCKIILLLVILITVIASIKITKKRKTKFKNILKNLLVFKLFTRKNKN